MNLQDIAPQRHFNPETKRVEGEHAFIAGITGFGKSFLVKRLDRLREYSVIHDPKDEVFLAGRKRVDKLSKLVDADPEKHPKLTYAPHRTEARNEDYQNAFFRWVFERENTTCILDELNFFAYSRDGMPEFMYECYTRGRSRGVEIWAITQEPSYIPTVSRTQTKHRYCFYVADDAHQERMTGLLPGIGSSKRESMERIRALPERHFYYYRLGEKAARGPYKLRERGSETLVEQAA